MFILGVPFLGMELNVKGALETIFKIFDTNQLVITSAFK